jgi:endonuclease/exonuclease/phosphatase family metal-dependent hydrolase
MIKKTFILTCVLLAYCLSAEPGQKSGTIKLATWNIEWLNASLNRGRVKRSERDYSKLREYAARLEADVVALQEVDGAAAAKRVFDAGRYNFEFSGRGNVQAVGFVVKKGIKYTRHSDYRALGLEGDYLRWGVDITLHLDNLNLRLLTIHLKGSCHEGGLARSKACRKLNRQLALLEKWIDARAKENTPFAVLGDFNRRLNARDAFWLEIDDGVPQEADLTNAGEGKTSRCEGGKYPQFIDHMIFSRRAGKLIGPGSFSQLVYTADEERDFALSDHCPVSVMLSFGR